MTNDRTFPLLQFEVRAFNYRTGKLERVTNDNWRDFVPQMQETLDLYDALLLDGEQPVDAAIQATVLTRQGKTERMFYTQGGSE